MGPPATDGCSGSRRWQVDEIDGKVAGQWRNVDSAIDQSGQVLNVFVSSRRDTTAARRCFQRAIAATPGMFAHWQWNRAAW